MTAFLNVKALLLAEAVVPAPTPAKEVRAPRLRGMEKTVFDKDLK